MNPYWWEDIVRFVNDYWWVLLLIIFVGLTAYFTRDLWMPLLGM